MYNENDYNGYQGGSDRKPESGIDRDIDYTEGSYTDYTSYEARGNSGSCTNQNFSGGGPDRGHIPPDPEKRRRSGGFLAKRAGGIVAAGILFGCVAGGTMVGVNAIGSRMMQTQNETAASAELSTAAAESTEAAVISAIPVSTGNDVSAIVEKNMPSVVAINSTTIYTQEDWFFGKQQFEASGSGSGIIARQTDSELLIVTNQHVVQNSNELSVAFIDGTSVKAAVKGTDTESDLAIIAVQLSDIPEETRTKIKPAELGDSDTLKMGQGVVAIGNALGQGQSVTVGYVSALDKKINVEGIERTLLQVDAAINPGNSGGALLNMQGQVIGINAAKYADTDVEGVGFAIPISYAMDIMEDLMSKTTKLEVAEDEQGYLGIQLQNIDSRMSQAYGMPQGIYIYKIVEGGAAANSDLRERDIITKFDGETVKTGEDLQRMMTYYKGGTTVTLTVQSLENGSYQERQVEVTLGYKKVDQALQEAEPAARKR